MQITNLDESDEYQVARAELAAAEIELMHHVERVAERRRRLPPGPVLDDYVFVEGPADLDAGDAPASPVKLSDLFTSPDRALVIYQFMFGKRQVDPCPMCTMWIDGFNGVAHHVEQNVDLAIVAAADLSALRAHGRDRGWRNLRLLSAGTSSFKLDLGSEDVDGNQDSRVSVFAKDADGRVRHTYTGAPRLSEDIDQRGIDPLCSTWSLLDLSPTGRGDWYASLRYS